MRSLCEYCEQKKDANPRAHAKERRESLAHFNNLTKDEQRNRERRRSIRVSFVPVEHDELERRTSDMVARNGDGSGPSRSSSRFLPMEELDEDAEEEEEEEGLMEGSSGHVEDEVPEARWSITTDTTLVDTAYDSIPLASSRMRTNQSYCLAKPKSESIEQDVTHPQFDNPSPAATADIDSARLHAILLSYLHAELFRLITPDAAPGLPTLTMYPRGMTVSIDVQDAWRRAGNHGMPRFDALCTVMLDHVTNIVKGFNRDGEIEAVVRVSESCELSTTAERVRICLEAMVI